MASYTFLTDISKELLALCTLNDPLVEGDLPRCQFNQSFNKDLWWKVLGHLLFHPSEYEWADGAP